MQHIASATASPQCTPKQAYHWLKAVTVDAAKAFKGRHGEGSLSYATVGPGDLLYLPAGWTYYEKVGNQDFIGIKHVHIGLADMTVLEDINKTLPALEAPNASLQAALDCLAMCDA